MLSSPNRTAEGRMERSLFMRFLPLVLRCSIRLMMGLLIRLTVFSPGWIWCGLRGAGYGCELDALDFILIIRFLLEDIPGPQVVEVNVTDETDFLGNGIIEIIANGSTPVIYYSLDGGTTYQSNNGTFNNLG
jgi:hypothetical protein